MINVGRIINSPNFAQTFTVYREGGSWQVGEWVATETPIQMTGAVTVANPRELVQVPEGDRASGVMCFYSQQEIFTTRTGERNAADGTSDQIEWNGQRYRVSSVAPWSDYGYFKALAVSMEGK